MSVTTTMVDVLTTVPTRREHLTVIVLMDGKWVQMDSPVKVWTDTNVLRQFLLLILSNCLCNCRDWGKETLSVISGYRSGFLQ